MGLMGVENSPSIFGLPSVVRVSEVSGSSGEPSGVSGFGVSRVSDWPGWVRNSHKKTMELGVGGEYAFILQVYKQNSGGQLHPAGG